MFLKEDDLPTGADKEIRMDIEYISRRLSGIKDESDSPTTRLRRQLCLDALNLASSMIVGERVI